MNILFITTKCPLPTNDGHSLRSFNLLKQVATKHNVHLLSFVKYQQEYESIPELETVCSTVKLFDISENKSKFSLFKTLLLSLLVGKPFVACKYDSEPMRKAIKKELASNSIDLIHFDMLPLTVYLDEAIDQYTVLNEHNVESMLLKRRVDTEKRIVNKWFFRKQQRMLEKFERSACQNVHAVITCSEDDRKMLKSYAPDTPVDVIPNGVDTDFFSPDHSVSEEKNSMIFVGGLNWFPNLDAMQWFDEKILPDVLQEYPAAHLHIIGQESSSITWKNAKAITCHGFVEDIRPYMAKASLFIVPLRIGGGTRLKILNAMSMGKAVVSTTVGAEGLGVTTGKNVVLADNKQHLSKAITTLFRKPQYRKEISIKGQGFIETYYQWEQIGNKLLSVYDGCEKVGIA